MTLVFLGHEAGVGERYAESVSSQEQARSVRPLAVHSCSGQSVWMSWTGPKKVEIRSCDSATSQGAHLMVGGRAILNRAIGIHLVRAERPWAQPGFLSW